MQVGEHEVCTFIEVSQDDKIEIFFKLGYKFKKFLTNYFKTNKLPTTVNSIENKSFKTDIATFKKHFNKTLVHYNMMTFIGKTIGIDFVAVDNKTALKVKLIDIKAQTSEPSDNKSRKVKEKKKKYIIVDFEILNQPAVNYAIQVFKGKEKIYEVVYLPEVIVKANKNPNNSKIDKPISHDQAELTPAR